MEMKGNLRSSHALLPLGEITITSAAYRAFTKSAAGIFGLLEWHRGGNWGEAEEGYAATNDVALQDGGEVISAYEILPGVRVRYTTTIRASTHIALDEER